MHNLILGAKVCSARLSNFHLCLKSEDVFRACRILMEFYSNKRRAWKQYVWVRLFGEFQYCWRAALCCCEESKGESAETKRRIEKEAGIPDSVKGHKNIARFLRFCQEPQAIMMEYSCFDFGLLFFDKMICEFHGQVRVHSCAMMHFRAGD